MKNTGLTGRRERAGVRGDFILFFAVLSVFCWGCQGETFNFDMGGSSEIVEKSGELTADEVWEGRIYITSGVVVPEGVTLTIRSGTIVGFEPADPASSIVVRGELYAEGSPERMIVFGSLGRQRTPDTTEDTGTTSESIRTRSVSGRATGRTSRNRADDRARTIGAAPPKAGDWEGIVIEAESVNSRLAYCRIQHASTGITCRTDSVQVERCLFSENKTGVISDGTSPSVRSNEFNRNGTGSHFRGDSAADVAYNEFTANNYGIMCADDSRPRIQYNILRANYENAIVCYSTASPEIVSNNITMNVGWAVYDGGRLRDNFIQGNRQLGAGVTELGTGPQAEQYYGVDESFEPRNSPVTEAGVPRENF